MKQNDKGEFVTIGEIEELPPTGNFKGSMAQFSRGTHDYNIAEKIRQEEYGDEGQVSDRYSNAKFNKLRAIPDETHSASKSHEPDNRTSPNYTGRHKGQSRRFLDVDGQGIDGETTSYADLERDSQH